MAKMVMDQYVIIMSTIPCEPNDVGLGAFQNGSAISI